MISKELPEPRGQVQLLGQTLNGGSGAYFQLSNRGHYIPADELKSYPVLLKDQ